MDCAKLFLCADSRFAEPRNSPEGERVVTFCIVQKVTKKHAGLRPATSIQSSAGRDFAKISGGSCRNRFCPQNAGVKALNRCERVTVVQTQDRYFFEKEKVYCKLTAASDIRKGLLHVSFGAVGNCCRSAPRNSISLSVSFA